MYNTDTDNNNNRCAGVRRFALFRPIRSAHSDFVLIIYCRSLVWVAVVALCDRCCHLCSGSARCAVRCGTHPCGAAAVGGERLKRWHAAEGHSAGRTRCSSLFRGYHPERIRLTENGPRRSDPICGRSQHPTTSTIHD